MLRRILPTALALTSLLQACTVGPDYKRAADSVIETPAANGAFSSQGQGLSSVEQTNPWWRLYDDRRLDDLIAMAFAGNTDLRMAEANLERSAALLREAKTLQEPTVPVQAGVQYAQQAGEQYLLPITPPVSTDYQVGVSIGYDLDLFGGIRRGIEAQANDHRAIEAARDLVKVNVAAETTRAYVDACGAGLQLESAKKSLELQSQSLSLTEKLFLGGRAIDLDIVRSRQLVDQLTGAIPPLEAARRNALYRLATLTGQAPGRYDPLLEQCAAPPRILSPLPVGNGAQLLRRRPDVRAAEFQLAAATARIGVATAELYPDIRLGAGVGSLGAAKDILTSPTNFWNLGLIVNWQANQSATRAKIDAANAAAKGALAQFDGTVLGALRDVETALNVYVHDLQREQSARQARDDAQQAARDATKLQLAGRATELSVVDANRTLAASEQTLAQVQSAIAEDQVNVFLTLGGGWQREQSTNTN
jgi:NodT family efflux transporter outer membrane factor (OMF) lipoprotein